MEQDFKPHLTKGVRHRRENFGGLVKPPVELAIETDQICFRVNKIGIEIIELCTGEISLSDIVQEIKRRHKNINDETIIAFVNQIGEIGLFDSCNRRIILSTKKFSNNTDDKPIVFPKLKFPSIVFWELTDLCNLRCKHCYTGSGLTKNALSAEQIFAIEKQLLDNGIFYLGLGGGEPLLVCCLDEIIERATKEGVSVSLSTNGILVTKRRAAKLSRTGLSVIQVSIDGPETIHDFIRGKGVYEKAIRAITILKNQGMNVRCAMTVNNLNFDKIEETFLAVYDLGIDWFIAFRCMQEGRANSLSKLTSDQLRIATETLVLLEKKYPKMISYEKLVFFPFLIDQSIKAIRGCEAGRSICNITFDGKITPCPHSRLPVLGNLTNNNIRSIWEKTNPFSMDIVQECLVCKFSLSCNGGCKGISMSKFGDDVHADQTCWNLKSL
ncbi:MAG: radical SAM protein [bacterium]|nr:radical SAM protein [bacterium]